MDSLEKFNSYFDEDTFEPPTGEENKETLAAKLNDARKKTSKRLTSTLLYAGIGSALGTIVAGSAIYWHLTGQTTLPPMNGNTSFVLIYSIYTEAAFILATLNCRNWMIAKQAMQDYETTIKRMHP